MHRTDFLVVGSGPAGQRAAIQAAKFGKTVVLVERRSSVGGVTVHTGTIPSKTLREAILYLTGWRQREIYGRDYRLKQSITVDDLAQRLQFAIGHEVEVIQNQLRRNGVEVVTGDARFAGPNEIEVLDRHGSITSYQAEKIFLATGTRPRRPDNIPFNNKTVIDSDGVVKMQTIPKSIVIYGAGVIGIEYATIFNALDTKVTLINESDSMLPFVDGEIMEEFTRYTYKAGMQILHKEKLQDIDTGDAERVTVTLASGRKLTADYFLFTAGRIGCTSKLQLEKAGLKATDRCFLEVNEAFQTAVPHIYAGGDLIGYPSLASTSMEQGRIAACLAFGEASTPAPKHFPYGIYTVPEISMIGLTEEELKSRGIDYVAGTAWFRETGRGQIMGLDEGLLKLLVARDDHRILGVHIVGEGATELIHIGQATLLLNGTLEYFVENTFNYPTLAEAYKIAALHAWNRLR